VANFLRDNSDLLAHLRRMDLDRIAALKEREFEDWQVFPDAPRDAEDARDSYLRVLDVVGEISGEFIAPRSEEIDRKGLELADGEVLFPRETIDIINRLKQADIMGFLLPRKYGGINMPMTVYMAAIEIVSRADASIMLLFGLQGIGETITRFGSEEQKARFLPRFCSGKAMGAMALTEPDAGSDLQSVSLRASLTPEGRWTLNGVKRFITNGCADISLVMARSEPDTPGARGLSLFICERSDKVRIRRIEKKMGLHGSPTCELQFNDAPAELLGKRKFGLVKYTMTLLNGARLAVAAQAVGLAEAAYREAYAYANTREQFGQPVRKFSAVYEMLTDMRIAIEAGRSLLYEAARIVDLQDGLDAAIGRDGKPSSEAKKELRSIGKYAALLTPMVKAWNTEMANRVCFDAIQVHGGVGYSRDFNVERHYRDVRVTNIYEGTTQLQVAGAIGGVVGGVVFDRLDDYDAAYDFSDMAPQIGIAREMRRHLESAVAHVKDAEDATIQEYHAGRLVAMATDTLIGYLMCIDGRCSKRKKTAAGLFLSKGRWRVQAAMAYILSEDLCLPKGHETVLDEGEDVSLPFTP